MVGVARSSRKTVIIKINMAFKKLLNLPAPSELFEATTKDYVDTSINDVVDKAMKKRTHLIAAHASYQGDLIKGDTSLLSVGLV